MSKLLKFKEYVTPAEAAKLLTTMLSEEVTEADVVALMIAGHLTASIFAENWACYFPGGAGLGRPDDVIHGVHQLAPGWTERTGWTGVPVILSDGTLANCYEIRFNAGGEITQDELEASPSPYLMPPWRNPWRQPIAVEAHIPPSTEAEHLVIRREDLQAFAAKCEAPTTKPDLDPRERATFERLLYVLAREAGYHLTGKCYADETAILEYAATIGVKVPTGKGKIAEKLRAAATRATKDRDE